MSDSALERAMRNPPLTLLSDEEGLFQSTVRDFAEKEVPPHVEAMDREGVFRHDLLEKLFAHGFMSIEIPEAFGGSGGSFFMSILAIEEFARVDASASVVID